MRTRIVKVERPVIGATWRISDAKSEHAEDVEESAVPSYVRECMGARMIGYFRAIWTADDGWLFKTFYPHLNNQHRF